MPALNLPDGIIHYAEEGSGPHLILLHSLGGSGIMWKTTVKKLASRYTIIAPDARGHGCSCNEGETSVEQYALDVTALIQQRGLNEVSLVGLSMGAQAAMLVAATLGKGVEKLVLADTSLGARGVGAEERLRATIARIAEIGSHQFSLEYAESRTLTSTAPEIVRDFAELVGRTLPEIFPRLQHSIGCQSLHEIAARLNQKTLVLVGDQDVSTPLPRAQEIASTIPNAQLSVIPDANHLANLDNPQRFNLELDHFL